MCSKIKNRFPLEIKSVKVSGRHLHRDVCRRENYFDTAGSFERLRQAVVKPRCAKCSSFKGLTAEDWYASLFCASSLSLCKPLAQNSSFGRLTFDSYSLDSQRTSDLLNRRLKNSAKTRALHACVYATNKLGRPNASRLR